MHDGGMSGILNLGLAFCLSLHVVHDSIKWNKAGY